MSMPAHLMLPPLPVSVKVLINRGDDFFSVPTFVLPLGTRRRNVLLSLTSLGRGEEGDQIDKYWSRTSISCWRGGKGGGKSCRELATHTSVPIRRRRRSIDVSLNTSKSRSDESRTNKSK